jgi:two-component system, OmpR family, phosphate regulon sensor histidine kinase PhoR
VSPTSRRIYLYWLLLLVPTLVVGGGAILLLRREQARLAELGSYANEARRAAITARARLIVENVELLVAEVQAGLLDTLAAEPAENIDEFLDELQKGNPLVRTAYRASADGRVLWPDRRTSSEEAKEFLRRFSREFSAQPPWAEPAGTKDASQEKREQQLSLNEPAVRRDVGANVAQWQSARRDVQELYKNQLNNAGSVGVSSDQAGLTAPTLADARSNERLSARNRSAESDRPSQVASASAPSAPRSAPASNASSSFSRGEGKVAVAPTTPLRTKESMPDRRGWSVKVTDGRLRMLGWVQPASAGDVRGVELELAALVSRLGGALPAEPGFGEGYVLRDDQRRVLHQAGAVSRAGTAIVSIPFAVQLLPGWDVSAYLQAADGESALGVGFFWMSVLLVGFFVAAILAGGSLLLWQARRSESEAEQKTSFVANVSHEFKTPLTTIRLYSELLEQGRVRDQSQGAEYLRTIGRETQRLSRLVNNALDFSRLEQGRKKYARDSIELVTELGRLLDTHAPRVAEAGLVLKREFPGESIPLVTDRDAVEQIVINLIDNACKYAADGGEILVRIIAAPGLVQVRVADRGPGVPPEHRERIFEKFHRVDDALTAEKTGAGLGLSIARQLARGLGGDLRFASREGTGAEFILELPHES